MTTPKDKLREWIKENCYCKRQEGTMFSKTMDSKQYCAFCWMWKELLKDNEVKK